MATNAELCKTRDQYRVLFGAWCIVALLATCNVGVMVSTMTDGGGGGGGGYGATGATVVFDVDGHPTGRPSDVGGSRAREMYYHLEHLAEEIYDDNVAKDTFLQSHIGDADEWTAEAKAQFYEMQFRLSQKSYLYVQKLRECKDAMIAQVEATRSSFVRMCYAVCEAVWSEVSAFFAWLTGADGDYVELRRENVALRVQLLQLHQKHQFLQKQFYGSDEEGYMVMMQQEGIVDELQKENWALSKRIEGLLGTCVCGNAYHTRAAAVIDYELKQCTHALDQCLGHMGGGGGFDGFDGFDGHEAVEEFDGDGASYAASYDASYDEGELPADFDVDEGVCDFFINLADACIVEKGEAECGPIFEDVRANCPASRFE